MIKRFLLFISVLFLSASTFSQISFKWSKQFRGVQSSSRSVGSSIALDHLGNIYVTGTFNQVVDFNPGIGDSIITAHNPSYAGASDDIFLVKLDSQGNFLWARDMGGDDQDRGTAVAVDQNNNVYITGVYSGSSGPADFGSTTLNGIYNRNAYVCKLDPSGNFQWVKGIDQGNSFLSGDRAITVGSNGYIYVTGHFSHTTLFGSISLTASGYSDIFATKMDPVNGNFLWAKNMGGSTAYCYGYGITTDPSGNVYVVGVYEKTVDFDPNSGVHNVTSTGFNDAFILKLNNSGSFQWVKKMAGTENDYARSIAYYNNNLYVTGSFDSQASFGSTTLNSYYSGPTASCNYITKISNAGNFQWAKRMGGDGVGNYGSAVAINNSGKIFCTGQYAGNGTFGSYTLPSFYREMYLCELDQSGNFTGVQHIGPTSSNGANIVGYSIALNDCGDIYTTGRFSHQVDFDPTSNTSYMTSTGGSNGFVLKLNNKNFSLNPSYNSPVCANEDLILHADNGGNNYNWTGPNGYSSSQQNPTIPNASAVNAGDYIVTATSNDGCILAKDTISVSINPSPTITTGADKTICSGESVSLSASGASSYSWNHSAGTGATPSVSPSTTTTYTVTGTTSGCSSTATQKVTVKTTPTITTSADKTICSGESVSLSASGASSYSWNHGAGTGATPSVSPTTTTTYTVTGTTSGCSNTATQKVTVKTTPTITTGADKTICSGESVSLSASGASSYSWNHSAGTGATPSVSPTTTTTYTVTGTTSGCSSTATQKVTVKTTPTVVASADQSICSGESVTISANGASSYSWNHSVGSGSSHSVSPSGTITYTVTGTTSGCSATDDVTITVTPTPTITTGADKTICSGESVSLSASGASSYSWNHSAGTGASPNVSPTSTTTYTVTGTTSGCSNTATQKVTVNTTPTVVASTDQTICAGESVTISASGANTYSWNHSVGSGSSHSVSPSATTTYTVTGTSNSCSGTDDITVTVNPLPTFTITDSVNPTACGNSDGTITLSGLQNNTSYSVSYNGNSSTSMTTNGSGEITITGLPAGSYANFTVALNGCSTSDHTTTVNLQDPNAPTVNAGTDQTICSGDSITLTASNPDGATITWNNGVTDGQTFVPTVGNTDTTIAYTVTANKSGCTASDQVNITVSITPTATASTTTSTLCAGETIVLTADTVMAGSYDWTGPNGFTSNNQQATVSNASPATAGTYILTITKNGCSATDSVSVNINPSPTAQATSSSATYCKGQTANLQASGGGQYNWTGPNNFTSSTQNPDIPNFGQAGEGWYVVTVTNSSGCKDEDSVQLSIGGLTGLGIVASDHQVCPGKDIVLTANGADSYTWSGPNGFSAIGSTVNLNNMSTDKAGTYYVTAQDSAGCTTTDTITVGIGMSSDCLFIPNLVTPNGDHKNDKWVITGIEAFPKAEVNIFNRWGNIVFHASPYKNNWKGQVNKGLDVGKGLLPSGTYFYVIKFNNGKDKDIKGYIELQY